MAKRTRIDENGVPVLSADDIELIAERLIAYFDRGILVAPQDTRIVELTKKLGEDCGVKWNFGRDLGRTENGNRILGRTELEPLGVYVDASVTGSPRFSFILAHELGHVVLHSSIRVRRRDYQGRENDDTEIDLATGRKILISPRDWLEWQANRFASAILMPRATIREAVAEKQEHLGIRRRLGQIFLDDQACNQEDYDAIKDHLEGIYQVSGTNIEYRLKDLGVLIDRRDICEDGINGLFEFQGDLEEERTDGDELPNFVDTGDAPRFRQFRGTV